MRGVYKWEKLHWNLAIRTFTLLLCICATVNILVRKQENFVYWAEEIEELRRIRQNKFNFSILTLVSFLTNIHWGISIFKFRLPVSLFFPSPIKNSMFLFVWNGLLNCITLSYSIKIIIFSFKPPPPKKKC